MTHPATRVLPADASYVAWGHSMVVSPFGVVIANLSESPPLTHLMTQSE